MKTVSFSVLPGRHGARSGFSIVELTVAAVLVATVAQATFAVLQLALRSETDRVIRLTQLTSARELAAHLADRLEDSVELPDTVPLTAGIARKREQTYLLCLATARPDGGSDWRCYSWPQDRSGDVEMRRLRLAGTRSVTLVDGNPSRLDQQTVSQVTPRVLCRGVRVRMSFKTAEVDWSESWSGSLVGVVARISVTAGDTTVERLVLPRVSGRFVGEDR